MASVPGASEPSSARNVENIAQALISAISREIGKTPERRTEGVTVPQALKRQFPSMFSRENKKVRPKICHQVKTVVKTTSVIIYALAGPTTTSPSGAEEMELAFAGLGKRVVVIRSDSNHEQIVAQMEGEFLKLKEISGRWMFYKAAGGSGQRKLNIIPMDAEGYTGLQIRHASNSGKITLFLVPLQESMSTEPLPLDAPEFRKMPQVPCIKCGQCVPLQMLGLHGDQCQNVNSIGTKPNYYSLSLWLLLCMFSFIGPRRTCPICQDKFPKDLLPYHASDCYSRPNDNTPTDNEVPGPSTAPYQLLLPADDGMWKNANTSQEAIQLFIKQSQAMHHESIVLTMDARDTNEDSDMALVSFYKQQRDKAQWLSPFSCKIEGDAAIGKGVMRHVLSTLITKLKGGFLLNFGNAAATPLFEGETDHLVPTAMSVVSESELFVMAGRIIGHSIVHGGPAMSGLSLAVVHTPKKSKELAMSHLVLNDCPDLDYRETIGLLLKDTMTEEETTRVGRLCQEWYFPIPNKDTNKLLLIQQLLSHVVVTRRTSQIKQIKKGLKETGIWELINSRPDVIPFLFPRECEVEICPQMILESVLWPLENLTSDSEDDDNLESEKQVVIAFFRRFIEEASSEHLRLLLRFWIGWEVPSRKLKLEVVRSKGQNIFQPHQHVMKDYACQAITPATLA
ncbi:hypothetical protein WMY93_028378 [Mugilogobius chulae]|uniref:HECT domain-containing protein n=1 Tax=Mugilogobius chulae TaxID=88201 RepID=A0AAW0MZ53_9GOBI